MAARLVCTPRSLPEDRRARAASLAAELNPDARATGGTGSVAQELLEARRRQQGDGAAVIAVVRSKGWGRRGARLTTAFMDNASAELRREILRHLNLWGARANVAFVASATDPQVRIARLTGAEWGGYWSYIGTDILGIPADEPTMNLEGFTMRTSAAEFRRVVCHEAGHTLGFPHEHMRREFVQRIDRQKAYVYFRRTEGWSPRDVDEQVLTPLHDASILRTPADQTSIMCYQLPGEITTDGRPILGGTRINATDHAFAALIYPRPAGARKRPAAKRTAAKKAAAKKAAAKKTAKKATRKTAAKRAARRRA